MNFRPRTRARRPARAGVAAAGLAMAGLLAACTSGAGAAKAATGTTTAPTASSPASTATVSVADNPRLGPIVADSGGETLYVFDGDTAGKIACTGACANLWLPVVLELGQPAPTSSGVSAPLGTVNRDEGPQVTLGGRPLYSYTKDMNPGDTNGNGVGGKWHAARPAGNPVGTGVAARPDPARGVGTPH